MQENKSECFFWTQRINPDAVTDISLPVSKHKNNEFQYTNVSNRNKNRELTCMKVQQNTQPVTTEGGALA